MGLQFQYLIESFEDLYFFFSYLFHYQIDLEVFLIHLTQLALMQNLHLKLLQNPAGFFQQQKKVSQHLLTGKQNQRQGRDFSILEGFPKQEEKYLFVNETERNKSSPVRTEQWSLVITL